MSIKALIRGIAIVLLCQTAVAGAALSQERSSRDEAKAMAEKAAAYFHEHGAEAAFEAYNNSDEFKDGDLYVVVEDLEGNMMAHGTSPALVGRNVLDLRDPTGKLFNHEFVAVEDRDWITYQWKNPVTNAVEDKATYIINVGDYVIGVGVYE